MNFDVLPDGWAIAKVSEAISQDGIIADGDWVETKDQDPNGIVRLIQLADIGDGNFRNKSERFMTTENAIRMNCTFLEIGDVLIARMPDPLGRACIFPGVSQKAVTVVDVCLIRLPDRSALQNKLLMYWINNPEIRNLIALQATGTTRKRITRKKLEELKLPLPPLAEQQQIAAKLDELLAQVDSIKTRLDTIPKVLKRFRQSVLAAAVSGKLTEDWRKSNGIDTKEWNTAAVHEPYSHTVVSPKNWTQTTLGEVVDFVGGSQPPKSTFSDTGGAGYIRLIQIRDYKSDKHTTYIPKSLAKRFCSKTDVMIGRYGPPIFQILRGLEGAYNVALMKAVPKSLNLDLEYLFYYLKQDILLKYVEAGSDRTAGQDGVRKELLLPYPFFLPQIEEQAEIVRRVEQLFAYADQIEQRVKDAQARVNHLTQSILAKAFRGGLTADWRAQNPDLITGENSAEALLKRIQQERTTKNTKSKTTKVKKKSSESMTPKQIIPVHEALRAAGKPLTGQDLLASAGYPSDANTQQLEQFFLDIRQQLELKTITRNRRENSDEDWFEVNTPEG